ncbi:MAG TPA: hypothetical protein VG267_04525 [Terracidiphilus sp.]|jgi:uncharacterized protein YerC|nr:hypothetical protein [Terracidiphilus sp.]
MAAKQYEPMIDVARASELMGISPANVRALVRNRQLNAITFPGSAGNIIYRFRLSDIDRAIRRTRNEKGFSPIYANSAWTPPPPPRPPRDMSRRGRPRIAFDVDRAEALRKGGMGLAEIAREIGVSSTTIANALRTGQREILRGPGRPSIEFDLEKAIAMRRQGSTFAEIAAELGRMSPATISKAVREAAPELSRPPGFRDNDVVARMVTMRRGGATYREIGLAFGLETLSVVSGFKSLGIYTPRVNQRGPRKQFDFARAVEMRRAGLSYAQIGKELGGLAATTVARGIRENSGLKGSLFNFDIKLALKMRRQGYGFVAISKAVGASRPTVTNAINIKMLSSPIRQFQPRFDVAKAKEMRRARKSYQAIAKELGVSAQTVSKHLKSRGVEVNVKYGPRFDLKLAKRLRREGKSIEEIAAECAVSVQTIGRYLNPPPKRRKRKPAGEDPPAGVPESPTEAEPAS